MKRCFAYYRMSTDRQGASIPDQREAVRAYAARHGYKIIREFQDDGISGDETQKRLQFQLMIREAVVAKVETILVWDQDRLGRFNSLEAGYWLFPLYQAGVKIESLDKGVLDWDDFSGRLIFTVQQEGKHEFLRNLSRNVVRGKLSRARSGHSPSGACPLGYLQGTWPYEPDPQFAPVIQRIYRDYLAGHSVRTICNSLAADGIRSRTGKRLNYTTVLNILRSETYIGTVTWNKTSRGKYFKASSNGVEQKIGAAVVWNSESDWIVFENNHPPIVTRAQFDAVQTAILSRKRTTTPHRNGGWFVLSGLIRCGYCGCAMTGQTGKDSGVLRYFCTGYMARGSSACVMNPVLQDEVVEAVFRQLHRDFFGKGAQKRIREERAKQLSAKSQKGERASLEKQLQTIDAKIETLKKRLCEVDKEFVGIVQGELRSQQAAKLEAVEKLGRIKQAAGGLAAIESRIKRESAEFKTAGKSWSEGDIQAVRVYLQRNIRLIEVWAEKKDVKTQRKWFMVKCKVQAIDRIT